MTSDIDIGGVKPLVTRTEIHCGRLGNTRISPGKPSYKSQEEQYQEIQELRRNLGELREEHSGLKARNRRLEEDLIRRDRQIEQLMDPSKNDEARRKLTDKGASLVSSLKLRVSRLEATLKDKEAELAKLQASAKATALNELKIEAETYYQEVVRLRNQLNIAQHQQQQHQQHYHQYQKQAQHYSPQHSHQFANSPQSQQQLQPPPPPPQDTKRTNVGHWSNMRSGRDSRDGVRGRRDGDGQESPSTSLRHALVQLEEENVRLGNQVSSLTAENIKLSADMERVLGLSEEVKTNYEGLSRAELIREVERGQEERNRLEAQHTQLTEALARRNDIAGESSALLQARISELQGREVEWERERASLRELINTLKEDRMFYKETAQKKDSELDSLRVEVQSLQQEVISLHEVQRRRNEQPTPSISQRAGRGSARPSLSSASRSGSSSDTNVPARRPRPSSARPPAPNSRLQRTQKSSSEPREILPPNRTQRTPTQQSPRKGPPVRSSSKPPSSSSSPSKASLSNMLTSGNNARPGIGVNRRPSTSSTTPKASPYGSPKHSSIGRTPSVSSTSKTPTPTSSPRKTAGSVSPQRKASGSASPQSKMPGSPSLGGRIPTSRSSSRTSTPSSTAKSSPSKTSSANRSPSKVPLAKSSASPAGSPSKFGKKREESASPSRTSRSSKQESLRDSSALIAAGSRRQVAAAAASSSVVKRTKLIVPQDAVLSNKVQLHQQEHNKVENLMHSIASEHSSHTSSIQEEDERVLAEILFHRETDSSGEASDHAHHLARQRTITLTSQDESVLGKEEVEPAVQQVSGSPSLQRQNTVTLSSKTDEEEPVPNEETVPNEEICQESLPVDAEMQPTTEAEEKNESEEEGASALHDDEIIENLEMLQSLLASHLSRQREVNELLSQEPLLVGGGQGDGDVEVTSGEERSPREAPDGEESSRGSSKRSQNMVRQGTFNVHGEESTVATIHATLDAHLTRVNKMHQFNTN